MIVLDSLHLTSRRTTREGSQLPLRNGENGWRIAVAMVVAYHVVVFGKGTFGRYKSP